MEVSLALIGFVQIANEMMVSQVPVTVFSHGKPRPCGSHTKY